MKTKNLAVGALAALLALALWYNFLLKPTRAQVTKIKADTEAERAKLSPLQAQVAQANADAAHAATFKAQLASLQAAVPDSPALADFIRDANQIAEESHISWQSVTHGPPTPGLSAESITVGIQVKGTYPQVIDYLTRMAALKRLVVIDTVQFSAAGTTGAGGATAGPGASTGPFSGASELTVTITGRMFETPPVVGEAAAGTGTASVASTGSGTSGTGTEGTQPATLKNS